MKQLKLKDFIDYKYIASFDTDKDSKYFSYVEYKANLEENKYNTELFISDGTDFHKAISLDNFRQVIYKSDTELLIPYAKTEEEKEGVKNLETILYLYDIEKKSFEKYHHLYLPVSNIEVISDELWLLHTKLHQDAHTIYEDSANRMDYINTLKTQELYEEIESIPFYTDGGDFLRDNLSQVILYNPKTKTYNRLFDKDMNIAFSEYNKFSKKVYFLGNKHTGISGFYNDAYVYDTETKKLEMIFEAKEELSISYIFELNNEVYLFASDLESTGMNSNRHFYKLNNSKAEKVLDFGLSAYNSTGSDARFGFNKAYRLYEDAFYFVGTYKDRSPLYKFDGQKLETIVNEKISIDGWLFFNDELYLMGLVDNKLQEIYKYKNELVQITNINTNIIKDKYIASPEYFKYENDGYTLDGWVLLPKNYDPEKEYPAILDIHGGPKTIYNDNFFHEMQVWVNLGYIVFYTNPRGGDSYDEDFSDIRGKYGTIDYDDLMKFTDLVIGKYSIDVDNIGVTGGSYGGFMTNWIVSHTDRFKAAATQRSISNWISFYGTSDIGYYFMPDQTGADPIIDFDKAWEQSPLKHAHNIKTPLLFIHSDKDYRCPIEQAMQLFTVVKKRGLDTRFIWFKNESHGLSRGGKPKSRVKRLEEITNWFEKYLKED